MGSKLDFGLFSIVDDGKLSSDPSGQFTAATWDRVLGLDEGDVCMNCWIKYGVVDSKVWCSCGKRS